jgi:hypothetical protein
VPRLRACRLQVRRGPQSPVNKAPRAAAAAAAATGNSWPAGPGRTKLVPTQPLPTRLPTRFPLELPAYSEEDLEAHLESTHKYCEFCDEYSYGAPRGC